MSVPPMSSTDAKRRAKSIPRRRLRLRVAPFGPPAFIDGEDPQAYDELLTQLSTDVKPSDIFEDIWVRDIVDHVWETLRLRRLKANLMIATAGLGLAEVLKSIMDSCDADDLAKDWAARKPTAIKRVDKLLADTRLTMHAVMAQTLALRLDDIERIDRMIWNTEARRNAVLKEIDRHRETLSQNLRRSVQQVEDGHLRVIENKLR
jgi:uncharacterized protein YcbX